MKNLLFLLALTISAGLNIYLYQRFTAADRARLTAEQHFSDCQQVTFQLEGKLSKEVNKKGAAASSATAPR